MSNFKRYIREILEAIGIACLFASPFIVYFMDMPK
jgi:hypothetical protein